MSKKPFMSLKKNDSLLPRHVIHVLSTVSKYYFIEYLGTQQFIWLRER